jgi:hypothetical protein
MWRMAGSDRWAFDQALNDKPAVLRVGFKPFPVCWHLQEYVKGFARLLDSLAPDDDVVEVAVTGPHSVEKFCQRELLGSADIGFSMPAAFSLLLSKVESGPQWYSVDDGSHVLRHRQLFSYDCSEKRAICLRTRRGVELNSLVDVCDYLNPAAWGLDEHGVLAKHRRLTHTDLRAAAVAALGPDGDGIPERLYRTIDSMMANPARQSASA